ncbi:MAG TPA: DUF5694 domain-containing protein [Flavisolibacter sp.]
MKKMLPFVFCLVVFCANAQKVDWEKLASLQSDNVLLSGERHPAKVLLLGTFHFAYPQADGHKTDPKKFIDVLSNQRQKEMQELADVIKRFQPTRIYIESSKQRYHDSLYSEYQKGKYKLGSNEVYQVAYRVAGQMNLPRVYTADAGAFTNDNYRRYPWIDSMWKNKGYSDTLRDQYWNKMYERLYNAGDSIETTLTMLENFLLMAEPSTLNRMHGHYLAGGFNTKGNTGPDLLAMWWYSRNLRIFNNILNTQPTSQDRIVVLFGNGHMPILKHCFQSSPEFEVVELKSLLK